MARSGLYKSDVQRARDRLRATGTHPSVDAVRVALGNTGSKTTIHRYLRELEDEEGQSVGAKMGVSDALQDLIARLAERLHAEADTVVAQAQARFQAQLQERTQALEQARHEADSLSTQLQRTEIAVQAEREASDAARSEVASRATELAQLEERIAGLTARLAEHERHAQSLEQKHDHAREALEHYRTSVKDQREQEQRRHAHQVQELQVALRQANEALTAKNHDLMQLNRDNGQWVERHTRLERELAQARQRADAQQRERDALRLAATEYQALQVRWTGDVQALEGVRTELAAARTDLIEERQRREHAEADTLRATVRLSTLEQLLEQLRPPRPVGEPENAIAAGAMPAGR
ncbi:DNA-binding protein [Xanthomonas campestris pv. campestris]|uniref:DNA-binding protein n=1 Tax=Xanthomonas campestris TaxID=339 RepID=UPI001C8660FD|nr:DNA-binding protein [Xanthomonas campestris]MDM7672859.1 DNA-binding protein [Xanthomonas campestris pv. campestris]MDM7693700.1 DNA-binding protein [Xanthomonas campestris pv. campestris]MDM7697917.1 DNA-binding protein [Xanthomonas campestris pv. campestris]MDM7714663.1 DNA-binding protein [Xanthomonas campestris pv. campestris]MDM7840966.1 DNA-binding protein [Xanthomonas campestris pv. campestris]